MSNKGLSTKEFLKDTKGGKKAESLDLKKAGKLIVFFHPGSGIQKRQVHWFPVVEEIEVEGKKGKKTKKNAVINRQKICPGFKDCPICQLRSALRDKDDIDNDEIILKLEGDDGIENFRKGDLVGVQGYDWQRDVGYRKEYLFGAVDTENVDKGVQTLYAPNSLGKEITKVIEEQIEEEGEEQGDPFQTPYGFKLIYDEDEPPTKKYSATYHAKAKLTDEIKEVLEDEDAAIDLEALSTPTDIDELKTLVRDALAYDADELDLDLSTKKKKKKDDDDEDEKPAKKKKTDDDEDEKPAKKKKTDDDEDEKPKKKKKDDDDEDEKPKKKKKDDDDDEKPVKKKKDDDDDDDKPTKKPTKKLVKKDDDDDEKPVKKKKDDDDDEDEKPKKKKKDDDDDDEKPVKKKKKDDDDDEDEKPKKKKKDDDDDEDELTKCPQCKKSIAKNATKCPHCKAKFEVKEMIECANCGEEVDANLEKCPKCGDSIVPF